MNSFHPVAEADRTLVGLGPVSPEPDEPFGYADTIPTMPPVSMPRPADAPRVQKIYPLLVPILGALLALSLVVNLVLLVKVTRNRSTTSRPAAAAARQEKMKTAIAKPRLPAPQKEVRPASVSSPVAEPEPAPEPAPKPSVERPRKAQRAPAPSQPPKGVILNPFADSGKRR